jgi:hypothetical protein
MFEWLATVATKDNVSPGGFAHAIHEAAENGAIAGVGRTADGRLQHSRHDTTLQRRQRDRPFAQNPDQWDLSGRTLRADASRVGRGAAHGRARAVVRAGAAQD